MIEEEEEIPDHGHNGYDSDEDSDAALVRWFEKRTTHIPSDYDSDDDSDTALVRWFDDQQPDTTLALNNCNNNTIFFTLICFLLSP